MLDTQLVIQIYESDKDIDTLSKDLDIEPEIILKIRIGKYGSEHTKDLVPGMLLVRHRLRRQPNRFTQIELDYIAKSSDPYRKLADQFGVYPDTIHDIKHGLLYSERVNSEDCFVSKPRKNMRNRHTLTPEQVQQIIFQLPTKSNSQLSKEFGVAPETISDIRRNKSWQSIKKRPDMGVCREKGWKHHNRKVTQRHVELALMTTMKLKDFATKHGFSYAALNRAINLYKINKAGNRPY